MARVDGKSDFGPHAKDKWNAFWKRRIVELGMGPRLKWDIDYVVDWAAIGFFTLLPAWDGTGEPDSHRYTHVRYQNKEAHCI